MSTNFDIEKERKMLHDNYANRPYEAFLFGPRGKHGIDIVTSGGHRLFVGNILINSSDGSIKGYGHAHRWRGSGGCGYSDSWVDEFLIGCVAMNAKTEKIGLAFYRLCNDKRYGKEENDPYWHEPQIIISVGSSTILDDACTDGVYRNVNPDRKIKLCYNDGYSSWSDPVQGFNRRLNLEFGDNRVYAENGIEFCRKIVREL